MRTRTLLASPVTTTQDRYRGMPALRDKAAAHVRSARGFWRHARDARRWDWPDVASTIEDRARHHLRVARWLADGAPHLPGTLVHRTVGPRTLYLGGGGVMAVANDADDRRPQ